MTVSTPNAHLAQGSANRDHAEWLLATRPSDPIALQWAVTASFYSALHGLTAYLLGRGIVVTSHVPRARALSDQKNGVPLDVFLAYRDLEDDSKWARYLLRPFTAQEVRDLLDTKLAAVAAFVGM